MRTLIACLSLAAATLAGAAARAAEPDVTEGPTPEAPEAEKAKEEPAEEKLVRLYGEGTVWFTQPVGVDYVYATETDPISAFATRTRNVEFGTNDRVRWRVGAVVKGDVGSFVLTYWGAAVDQPASELVPGRFIIGEELAYPLLAGVDNDGLADGVLARTRTATRDLRLDFLREAFHTGRMSARWLAGVRLVDHDQSIAATYYALVPNLPPLIGDTGQPLDTLVPAPDSAARESRFSGRGIETGFEASYTLLPKLRLEGTFVYSLLRGESQADYTSVTTFYTVTDESGAEFYLPPEFYATFFGDPALLATIRQRAGAIGVHDRGSSTSASVLEAGLGFRWKAWRDLDVLGGVRQTRYENAVLEIKPRDAVISPDGTFNLTGIEKSYRSVGYEGFYLGIAYTY